MSGSSHPQKDLQVKILRPLGGNNAFVSYVDAIGELDHELCVIDWKTSTSCYPTEPDGSVCPRPADDLLLMDDRH